MLSALFFTVITLLLLPIIIFGYILAIIKVVSVGRRTGVSVTAYEPLAVRWMLHEAGFRDDEAVKKIPFSVPSTSALGWWAFMGPILLASRLSGYVPGMMRFPEPGTETRFTMLPARTEFFDQAINKHLPELEQVVILGAGFDTRAYSLLQGKAVKVFEVDQEATQRQKLAALEGAGIEHAGVTFVAADFNVDSWLDLLVGSGFDPSKKSFFLWEGVTYYLEEEVVRENLRMIAQAGGKGSVVAFDYFSDDLSASGLGWVATQAQLFGAPVVFGLPTSPPAQEQAQKFLKEEGFTLDAWRAYGPETEKKQSFGGMVAAIVD